MVAGVSITKGLWLKRSKVGVIDMGRWQNILGEDKKGIVFIHLFFWGHPLLHWFLGITLDSIIDDSILFR